MILPNDEESIRRMLGCDEIPAEIEPEYDLWLRMRHRDGATGALGPDLMLCLIRQLKLTPPAAVVTDEQVDWRRVPKGARVVVSVNTGDHLGTYQGKVDFGTLAILLDGDRYVREINVRYVKPHHEHSTDLNLTDDDTATDATPGAYADQVIDLDDDHRTPVDWTQYKRGTKVYVQTDEDVFDGTLWQCKQDELVVKIGAEKVICDPSQVVLVEI